MLEVQTEILPVEIDLRGEGEAKKAMREDCCAVPVATVYYSVDTYCVVDFVGIDESVGEGGGYR